VRERQQERDLPAQGLEPEGQELRLELEQPEGLVLEDSLVLREWQQERVLVVQALEPEGQESLFELDQPEVLVLEGSLVLREWQQEQSLVEKLLELVTEHRRSRQHHRQ